MQRRGEVGRVDRVSGLLGTVRSAGQHHAGLAGQVRTQRGVVRRWHEGTRRDNRSTARAPIHRRRRDRSLGCGWSGVACTRIVPALDCLFLRAPPAIARGGAVAATAGPAVRVVWSHCSPRVSACARRRRLLAVSPRVSAVFPSPLFLLRRFRHRLRQAETPNG